MAPVANVSLANDDFEPGSAKAYPSWTLTIDRPPDETLAILQSLSADMASKPYFPSSNAIEDISLEDWNRSLRVNLDGPFHVLAETLKWMKVREKAQAADIIFVASKNAPAPGKGAAAYSVAKAAHPFLRS